MTRRSSASPALRAGTAPGSRGPAFARCAQEALEGPSRIVGPIGGEVHRSILAQHAAQRCDGRNERKTDMLEFQDRMVTCQFLKLRKSQRKSVQGSG